MDLKISIIIPAFNEEDRIGNTLEKIREYMEENFPSYEILVVNDGSSDKTTEKAENHKSVLVLEQPKNLGKGAAVRRGMLEATGDIRVFSDADLSTPIYELNKLMKSIERGADVAVGSRALDYSSIKKHQPFYREFMGKTFNKIVQILVIKGIKDTQCGFKAFKRNAAQDIFKDAKIDGFGFDVEILFLANRKNYKVDEISVEWYNDERSKISPVKDSLKMISEILRIRAIHK